MGQNRVYTKGGVEPFSPRGQTANPTRASYDRKSRRTAGAASVLEVSMSLLLVLLSAGLAFGQTTGDLLNPEVLHEVRLTMAASDWQTLKSDYLADTVYPCSFAWNGYTLDKIGIKSRGSQSRSPIKPSLGLDFSKYTQDLRFASLKTLVLRNLNQDASMMHEFLAEAIFARLGLPHSRVAYAKLYVNNEYAGVYLMVEPIDARFIKVRFGEETGYLYDVQDTLTPYHFEFLGPDPALYVPGLFDPKSSDPDAEGVMEMVRQINQAPVHELDKVVDIDAILGHAAAETAISNWDGLLGINGMRNFYLYRWAATRRAIFLAWDLDAAFADIDWPIFEPANTNVLTQRLLTLPENRKRFLENLDAAAHAIGDGDWLANQIIKTYQLIQPAVYEDPYKLCRGAVDIGPCTNAQFELDIIHLRQYAFTRPQVIWRTIGAEYSHDAEAPDLRPSGTIVAAPGSVAFLQTPLSVSGPFRATSLPLPEDLAGITVQTEAGQAKLFEVSPEGVTFLVPETLTSGPQTLIVSQNSHPSNSLSISLRPTMPVVLGVVRVEEWIVIYATGLGETPQDKITLTVNGAAVPIYWAGAAPGLIGMQQINAIVPEPGGALRILVDNEPGPEYVMP